MKRIFLTIYSLDFHKIKEKGEKRGMDSAGVTIQRVPVCRSILVSGISEDTTQDAIELFFESPRYNGGPVETVRFKPESGRAVVVFQNSTGQNSNAPLMLVVLFGLKWRKLLAKVLLLSGKCMPSQF